MGSWLLQWQAGLAPSVGAAAKVHDVLGAHGHGHLSRNRRPVADGADEKRAVTELALFGFLQDLVEKDMSCPGNVAFVPLPVVANVHHLVAFIDQLLNLVHVDFLKRLILILGFQFVYSSSSSLPANP